MKLIKMLGRLAFILSLGVPLFSAAKQKPVYVNAETLPKINLAQSDAPGYQRLDADKYPLTKTVDLYFRFPTGIALLFQTNSSNIHAKWHTANDSHPSNSPLITQSGLDLYILKDGKWVFAGVGKPSYNSQSHKSEIAENMDGSMKQCMLYLPLFDRLDSLKIGIDPGARIEPVDNPFKGKVIAIGSSITHGSGTSRPGMAWPARLQRALGAEVVNLGASGQCKLESFFAQIAAESEADAFIFDVFSNPSAEQIFERFDDFLKIIRASHPKTPLIFLQTLTRPKRTFNTKIEKFEAAKQLAAQQKMDSLLRVDPNVYFINPGMPIGDDGEATCDGVHPTDLGHERILSKIIPRILEILNR